MSHTRGLWFESRANTDGKYLSKKKQNIYFMCSSLFPHTSVQVFDVSHAVEGIEINALKKYFCNDTYISSDPRSSCLRSHFNRQVSRTLFSCHSIQGRNNRVDTRGIRGNYVGGGKQLFAQHFWLAKVQRNAYLSSGIHCQPMAGGYVNF